MYGACSTNVIPFATSANMKAISMLNERWVKPGNPAHTSSKTVLAGRIWIDGRTLKAEVNSAGRDKAFRGIIKRALVRQARYRSPPSARSKTLCRRCRKAV
jgi:hypothetical protein